MSDTNPDLVELSCDHCDFVAAGPDKGPGSARFKMGTHRYREHGIRSGKSKARSKGGRVTDEDMAERPVISLVRDVADQVGGGSGAPTAEQLAAGLGRGIGLMTVAVASFAVESDHGIPEGPEGDALRNRLIDHLSLSDKAARDTMRPIGKALHPTKFNKRYGRTVVDNVDVAASIAELATLALHWRQYLRVRSGPPAAAGAQPFLMPAGAPVEETPVEVEPPTMTSPAPTAGVLVTPDMIAAARARGGA